MKQETKELIDWIKESVRSVEHEKAEMFQDVKDRVSEVIAFLDSLPEIESHLCRGGYIQDRNGTPCRAGDKVKYEGKIFELHWRSSTCSFILEDEFKNPYLIVFFNRNAIEKAEK